MKNKIIADNASIPTESAPPITETWNSNPSQYLDLAEQLINHSDFDGARNYLLLCEEATLSASDTLRLMALSKRIN